MKFLILNTDYPEFLRWHYAQHPGLERESYQEQIRVRMDSLFGVADFYSHNLRNLGHEAWDIHASNRFMQEAWAKEHRVRAGGLLPCSGRRAGFHRVVARLAVRSPLRYLKSSFRSEPLSAERQPDWFYEILRAQIDHYKPDVLLNQAMDAGIGHFLKEMKPSVRLLVGQHAATPLPDSAGLDGYDLVVSSFPPTVDRFRQQGIPAELNRLAFEPRVLARLKREKRCHGVTFIGGLYRIHSSRVGFLECVCAQLPETSIWGPGVDRLSPASVIRRCYMGQAWGREMYEILHNSRIALNHHGDIPPFANNLRLFEATGVGALLITDWKANLRDMFEPGKEVMTYRTPEDCAELIRYYLDHEDERATIARAGQERTLQAHTYPKRMQELVEIVRKHL